MFIDEAKIYIKAGNGGDGCMSFRREKYIPLGGPNGGDGGDGGSVIFKATTRMNNLLNFRYQQHYRAENAGRGEGSDKHGKNGKDIIVDVPVGTTIKDFETGSILADLDKEGATALIAAGGRGGRGNTRFKSSTNRAPRRADKGTEGPEMTLKLELKLLADVGILGYPNAGKSTLISKISAAKPKIADYPFTSLAPSLGVVKLDDINPFVVADIPGIIKDAHKGKGLGIQFLKHVERTKLLLHIIDMSQEDETPLVLFDNLNQELESFSAALLSKPQIVVANKIDMPKGVENYKKYSRYFKKRGITLTPISSYTGEGVGALIKLVASRLEEIKRGGVNETLPCKSPLAIKI